MFTGTGQIFNINSEQDFDTLALDIFNYQYHSNPVYQKWVNFLKINPRQITNHESIPFLPIEFFKSEKIISGPENSDTVVFTSSSTTSQTPSSHFVTDKAVYEASFLAGFDLFYGNPNQYCILALLPNYLQRKGSSLVYMCNRLIEQSGHEFSGFFLDDITELIRRINELKKQNQKTILIGVSYALMDLADKGVLLNDLFTVMETGGMKGTRKEMLKSELHQYLKNGFGINEIHSEYGMTELLSQAYCGANALFFTPHWMKFLIRDVTDPLSIRKDFKTGGINVIDLANVNSCSFIATKDLGRFHKTGGLELMGRYDNSDIRGCNLMLGN